MPTKMLMGMPKFSAPLLLYQLSTLAGDILVPVPWKCLLGIDRSVAPLMPVTAMSGLECPFALHQKLLHDLKNEALLWMCLHQYQKMDKNSFLSVFMICSPEALAVLTECLRNRLYYTTTNIILHKHILQRIMWIFSVTKCHKCNKWYTRKCDTLVTRCDDKNIKHTIATTLIFDCKVQEKWTIFQESFFFYILCFEFVYEDDWRPRISGFITLLWQNNLCSKKSWKNITKTPHKFESHFSNHWLFELQWCVSWKNVYHHTPKKELLKKHVFLNN